MKTLLLLAILPLMTACSGQQEKIELAKTTRLKVLKSIAQGNALRKNAHPTKPQRGVID